MKIPVRKGAPSTQTRKQTTELMAMAITPRRKKALQDWRSPRPWLKLTSGCIPWVIPPMTGVTMLLM